MKKRTRPRFVRISMRMELAKIVMVKAYKRIRNGRIERVKSHYRQY